MDNVDLKLLKMLVEDAHTPLRKLGREVGLSTSGVRRRIKKLEKNGVIKKYAAIIDPKKYGYGVTAFISVDADSRELGELTKSLSHRHEVCELHRTTGGHDLMIKVKVKDVDALNKFVDDHIRCFDSVKRVRTTLAMETIKETLANL
ncbi:MAG: Lrp/AsnC family transcriptional regulator [Candidatus Hadarchaeum sp.]|uniref:Lrp/AsnC family transcriptional regulator n=1 Tax=Candidatus Hadarchaeum sp. TaxID=2883567 RepID=UPI003D0AC0F0